MKKRYYIILLVTAVLFLGGYILINGIYTLETDKDAYSVGDTVQITGGFYGFQEEYCGGGDFRFYKKDVTKWVGIEGTIVDDDLVCIDGKLQSPALHCDVLGSIKFGHHTREMTWDLKFYIEQDSVDTCYNPFKDTPQEGKFKTFKAFEPETGEYLIEYGKAKKVITVE